MGAARVIVSSSIIPPCFPLLPDQAAFMPVSETAFGFKLWAPREQDASSSAASATARRTVLGKGAFSLYLASAGISVPTRSFAHRAPSSQEQRRGNSLSRPTSSNKHALRMNTAVERQSHAGR